MFGKPNNKKKLNNININNVKLSSNLDIPASIGRATNKEFVCIKKKEKEKRISDKIKSEKFKIIGYYIRFHLDYKKSKVEYSREFETLIKHGNSDINRIIRLFRFTSEYNGNVNSSIIKYLKIIDRIIDHNDNSILEQITLSNIFYLFRNGLILIFLNKSVFQIDTNTKVVNLVNAILEYITNDSIENKSTKRKLFFNMILNYSMVDLLLLKFIEKHIINTNHNFILLNRIINYIFENNVDNTVECVYYTYGNDLFINIFRNQIQLKKNINLNENSNIAKFIENRNSWFRICILLVLIKSKSILGYERCINLFKEKIRHFSFNYFLFLIMSEHINQVRYVIKSNTHSNNNNNKDEKAIVIVPRSLFSYILMSYTLIEYNSEKRCFYKHNSVNVVRNNNTQMQDMKYEEFNRILFLINMWDFKLYVEFDIKTINNNKLYNHDGLNMNIDMDHHEENSGNNDDNIKYIKLFIGLILNESNGYNFEDNIRILLLIRLNLLFTNLMEKLVFMGSFILSDGSYNSKKYGVYEVVDKELLEENKIISKLVNCGYILNNIMRPLLNNALLLLNNKFNIEIATHVVNLILDIYFPLNMFEKPKLFDLTALNKRNVTNYIKNAVDICGSGNINNNRNGETNFDHNGINLVTNKIYKKSLIMDSESLNIDIILYNIKYLFYLENKNEDYFLLERIYYRYYVNEYDNMNVFLEQLKRGKVKFISEINNVILNYLVYDTNIVLVLFLLIQNSIILNHNGDIVDFVNGFLNSNKLFFLNIINYFGVTLNHQLVYSEEIEIIKSLNQMNINNNAFDTCTGNDKNDTNVNYYSKNGTLSYDNSKDVYLDLTIALEEVDDIICHKKKSDETMLLYGSEILKILLNKLTLKNLDKFVSLKEKESSNSSMNSFLLINMSKNKELIYISLFINNLSFLLITNNSTLQILNSIYGELSSRIHQIFIKLNYNLLKLDDLYTKIPWTILSISDLLKPKNILLKQALNIELHGSFPTSNYNNDYNHVNSNNSNSNELVNCSVDANYESASEEDECYNDDELFNMQNHNLNYSNISQNTEFEMGYSNNDNREHFKYTKDENKIDLVKIFNSTIKYVSNKSKYRLLKKIVKELSYLLDFEDRLCFYYHYISELKYKYYYQTENIMLVPRFEIRRTHLVEDGYFSIGSLDPFRLRSLFRIMFLDENGEVEAGIDGGGLLKDFIICISKELCSPEFGLFVNCNDNTLAPRDYYSLIEIINNTNNNKDFNMFKFQSLIKYCNINVLNLYEFLGKIVGKAIYEKILLEIEFNPVFLNSVFGQYNDFNDLANFDNEIYKNLLFIKNYDNDVSNLSITFSITVNLSSCNDNYANNNKNYIEIDLIPNGRNVIVNNDNKLLYIKILTRYKLITSIKLQSNAFLKGLSTVIPYESLKLFLPYEIQSLISGVYQKIDINNLKNYTTYTGYLETSPQVIWLWSILEEFSVEEQSEFLLFVTASRKAPLLGFQHLNPNFGIQIVPDSNRLPSASTCFNLLKLPTYTSKEILEKKLKQAIFNSKGFDLS